METPPNAPPPNDTPRPGDAGQLDIINLKLDKMAAIVDAARVEANANTVKVNERIDGVHTRLDNVDKRIDGIDGRVREVEEHKDSHIQKDLAEELRAGQLEKGFESLNRQVVASTETTGTRLDSNDRVNKGICQALGLDFAALSADPRALTQTQQRRVVQPTNATLPKIAKRQNATTAGGVIAIVILTLQLILQLLSHH